MNESHVVRKLVEIQGLAVSEHLTKSWKVGRQYWAYAESFCVFNNLLRRLLTWTRFPRQISTKNKATAKDSMSSRGLRSTGVLNRTNSTPLEGILHLPTPL